MRILLVLLLVGGVLFKGCSINELEQNIIDHINTIPSSTTIGDFDVKIIEMQKNWYFVH